MSDNNDALSVLSALASQASLQKATLPSSNHSHPHSHPSSQQDVALHLEEQDHIVHIGLDPDGMLLIPNIHSAEDDQLSITLGLMEGADVPSVGPGSENDAEQVHDHGHGHGHNLHSYPRRPEQRRLDNEQLMTGMGDNPVHPSKQLIGGQEENEENLLVDGHGRQQGAHSVKGKSTPNKDMNPFAYRWLNEHYTFSKHTTIARTAVYASYTAASEEAGIKPLNAATFGKCIKSVFKDVKTRRLGTRGQSRYNYCGIAPSSIEETTRLARFGEVSTSVPSTSNPASHSMITSTGSSTDINSGSTSVPVIGHLKKRRSSSSAVHLNVDEDDHREDDNEEADDGGIEGGYDNEENNIFSSLSKGKKRDTMDLTGDEGDQDEERGIEETAEPDRKKSKRSISLFGDEGEDANAASTAREGVGGETGAQLEEDEALRLLRECIPALRSSILPSPNREFLDPLTHSNENPLALHLSDPHPNSHPLDPPDRLSRLAILTYAKDCILHMRADMEKLMKEKNERDSFVRSLDGGEENWRAWQQRQKQLQPQPQQQRQQGTSLPISTSLTLPLPLSSAQSSSAASKAPSRSTVHELSPSMRSINPIGSLGIPSDIQRLDPSGFEQSSVPLSDHSHEHTHRQMTVEDVYGAQQAIEPLEQDSEDTHHHPHPHPSPHHHDDDHHDHHHHLHDQMHDAQAHIEQHEHEHHELEQHDVELEHHHLHHHHHHDEVADEAEVVAEVEAEADIGEEGDGEETDQQRQQQQQHEGEGDHSEDVDHHLFEHQTSLLNEQIQNDQDLREQLQRMQHEQDHNQNHEQSEGYQTGGGDEFEGYEPLGQNLNLGVVVGGQGQLGSNGVLDSEEIGTSSALGGVSEPGEVEGNREVETGGSETGVNETGEASAGTTVVGVGVESSGGQTEQEVIDPSSAAAFTLASLHPSLSDPDRFHHAHDDDDDEAHHLAHAHLLVSGLDEEVGLGPGSLPGHLHNQHQHAHQHLEHHQHHQQAEDEEEHVRRIKKIEEARAKNREKQRLYRERQKLKMEELERTIRDLAATAGGTGSAGDGINGSVGLSLDQDPDPESNQEEL